MLRYVYHWFCRYLTNLTRGTWKSRAGPSQETVSVAGTIIALLFSTRFWFWSIWKAFRLDHLKTERPPHLPPTLVRSRTAVSQNQGTIGFEVYFDFRITLPKRFWRPWVHAGATFKMELTPTTYLLLSFWHVATQELAFSRISAQKEISPDERWF
jgi:hypothetical protein